VRRGGTRLKHVRIQVEDVSSTVRIEEDAKDRLRRLQQAWAQTRGEQLSQKEMLGRGLAFLERHRDRFLQEAGWEPLSEEEIEAVEARAQPMGDWSARDIDEILYG
jgi:hypothetical protein